MYRRKVVVIGVAAFAIGAAFAAQPLSVHADRGNGEPQLQRIGWTPGTDAVMAAYETSSVFAPPR